MNVYAHVLPHIQEEAMGRFAEWLRGRGHLRHLRVFTAWVKTPEPWTVVEE
jgi:hypothetical protein